MEANDDGDLTNVAMPGFVDILSSVITIFMFFVLLTSMVMYFLNIQLQKNLEAKSKKDVEEKVSKEMQKYIEMLESGKISLEELKKSQQRTKEIEKLSQEKLSLTQDVVDLASRLQQERANMGKSLDQEVQSDLTALQIVIMFDDNAISLSPETVDKIRSFLKQVRSVSGAYTFRIEVSDNPNAPTLSVSRELGLGRILNVRNVLLAEKVPQASITVQNIGAEEIAASYNWVRIRAVRKGA